MNGLTMTTFVPCSFAQVKQKRQDIDTKARELFGAVAVFAAFVRYGGNRRAYIRLVPGLIAAVAGIKRHRSGSQSR